MKMNEIVAYLNELISNPTLELHYTKDYELLIAVMLSAQTTDKRVNQVTNILFNQYPNLDVLATATYEDIVSIIRSLGTYHKKASNVIVIANRLLTEQQGRVPNDRIFLESLPGVGRKTTNVVLGILYHEQVIAVDTHVARVSKRLGFAGKEDDVLVIEQKLTTLFASYSLIKLHHQLLLFGRYYCKARSPLCETCKIKHQCIEYQENKSTVGE